MRKNKNKEHQYKEIYDNKQLLIKKPKASEIGIDIGSSTLKIVQMKQGKVKNYGIERIPEGIIVQGRIESATALAELIRSTLKKNKIRGYQCSICLSSRDLIVRELVMPEMDEPQILENIKHEITSFLPLEQTEYRIDYKILEYKKAEDDNALGQFRMMVSAAPKALIQTYIDTIKKARLKVTYVDVIPNVVSKMYKRIKLHKGWNNENNSQPSGENVCIVDLGARTTNIILLAKGNYFIHKTINHGGDQVTNILADQLGMDPIDAEIYKRQLNFLKENSVGTETEHIKNYFDHLITDIERTTEFFANRNNKVQIEQIYLMGGGSLLQGLVDYMNQQLSIDVKLLSNTLDFIGDGPRMEELGIIAHGIGTTMREEWVNV